MGVLVAGGVLLAAAWFAPGIARLVVQTQRGGAVTRRGDVTSVDAFVAQALPLAGAATRLEQVEVNGVVQSSWQLDHGKRADDVAEALRDAARQTQVELHALSRDQLDAEIRVYAGSHLRHRILLLPGLPAATPLPTPVNRRERPLVAIIVAGLGHREATSIVQTPAPLTVAVAPFSPYALPTARDAALAWQEVLVDLGPGVDDVAAARAAVPFATGLLAREGAEDRAVAALDRGLLVSTRPVTLRTPAPGLAQAVHLLRPWQTRRRGAADLLARIRHLVVANGSTALMIEADDPSLSALLRWAADGHANGYRVVHASEVVRATDMIGILDAVNPRAQLH